MDSSKFQERVPNADPLFLLTLDQLPEPPIEDEQQLQDLLLKLHELFVKKQAVRDVSDSAGWTAILAEEVALLTQFNTTYVS